MSEWQPIETAPRDEHVIIAQNFRGRWHVLEARYVKPRHRRKGTWFGSGDPGDDEFSQPYEPSHWQPLPAPPAVAKEGT